ncbi:MAG TPA: M17 family metallopeptidase [Pilimelia sp.]|nr:M17 family metallopeptidase [Pilimelia sp.]
MPVRTGPPDGSPELLSTPVALPADASAEAEAALSEGGPSTGGAAGSTGWVRDLPRPLGRPERLVLVGIGGDDEAGWRAAGATAARTASDAASLTVGLPASAPPAALRGLAEGLWLATYRFSLATGRVARADGRQAPRLRRVTIVVDGPERYEAAFAAARATAEATALARDLTNMPSSRKNPAWFADQVRRAADGRPQLTVSVRGPAQLAAEGFGGILAVGGGSAGEPRLVELSWRPRGANTHVVLVGKGITFDTGGVSIKPRDAMLLMRKDMGGAAAVVAATLGAADMGLPVRVTALAPLAENMVGASAYRPGDVIRHYGGTTSESTNTDAEGRLVLADAIAYAVRRLKPDFLVDLATLTGANAVSLGRRTAALYSDNDTLAAALTRAATEAGEQVWRMPLHSDYVEYLGSEIADLYSCPEQGAGSVVAALYLREFTGALRDRWAHVDMSAPSWIDTAEGELARGATGWGVRTVLRWLGGLSPA